MSAEKLTPGIKTASLVLSLILCLFITICYTTGSDWCAALTLWPAWIWTGLGLVLLAVGFRKKTFRLSLLTALLWVTFALIQTDEVYSLARGIYHARADLSKPAGSQSICIVTLNCSGGNKSAAGEVERCNPDIVLLQESPAKRDVETLAHRLYGSSGGVAWDVDASIIARGKVEQRKLPPELRLLMSQARVKLASGREIEVISLRLAPPRFRIDLWSGGCWKEMADNKRTRREQISKVLRQIESIPKTVPVILGGDLNAHARDSTFYPLSSRLYDAFREGGRGWGNTVLNDVPVLRFDQIWLSRQFKAANVTALRSRNSDHRIVAADVQMVIPRPKP